jgi:HTH-type transcriptional regulator/antitoxin HipB
MEKNEAKRNAKNFDEILEYGKVGTDLRDEFEENAQYFVVSELLKDKRHEANITKDKSNYSI